MRGIIDHGQIRGCQGAAALFIFAALEDAQGVSFNGIIYLIYNLLGPTRTADVSLHGRVRLFEVHRLAPRFCAFRWRSHRPRLVRLNRNLECLTR